MKALETAYLRGEYETVLAEAGRRLRLETGPADEILYLQGMAAFKLRDWGLAQESLDRLAREYPRSRWGPQGKLALGDTFAAAGDFERALAVFEHAAAEGEAPFVMQAVFRAGKMQQRLGRWGEARSSFERVIREAPESAEAAQASEILSSGEFFFTVQVGAFANRMNALRLQAELKRRGYPADVQEAEMQGRTFHRVRVGRFAQRGDAQEQARGLEKDGFPARIFP